MMNWLLTFNTFLQTSVTAFECDCYSEESNCDTILFLTFGSEEQTKAYQKILARIVVISGKDSHSNLLGNNSGLASWLKH
jgi:hypothetical protein